MMWTVTFFVMVVAPDAKPIQHHWQMPSIDLCVKEIERTLTGITPMLPSGAKIQAGCHLEPDPHIDTSK